MGIEWRARRPAQRAHGLGQPGARMDSVVTMTGRPGRTCRVDG